MTIPPRPRSTIAGAKWWHSCIGTMQLRTTIASALWMELARNGSKLGSEPAQYTRQPTLQRDGMPAHVRKIMDQLVVEYTTIGFLSDDDPAREARPIATIAAPVFSHRRRVAL